WIAFPTLALRYRMASEVSHMQVIPIIWPVLLCAFLTGMLFTWVWFVALPRMRRAEKKARLGPRATLRARRALSRQSKSPTVDADQQAIRRNV
ncbi:MAG TPA: hypothetical protein VFI32_01485, partial [Rhodanobacteraceae bacterium]|nr:hypothetical protein [Rhodanobacteraceae bacterium]